MLVEVLSDVIDLFVGIYDAFDSIEDVGFFGMIENLGVAISDGLNNIIDTVAKFVKDFWGHIADLLGLPDWFTDLFGTIFDTMIEWLKTTIEVLFDSVGMIKDVVNFFSDDEETANTTTRPQMRSIGGDVTDRTADYATRNAQVMQPVVIDNNTTNTEVRDVNVYLDSDKIAGKVEKRMVMANRLNSY